MRCLFAKALFFLGKRSAEQHFQKVKKVWLTVGVFSGVEIDALRFGWDVVTRNSIAEGAELIVIGEQGQAWCMGCSKHVQIENRYDDCPACGSHQLQVTGGETLSIKEIE
ncbi:hydrogenase maturation nickel metallochaperone HypA [Thiomicrorhabdus sp.]|uniref:hydrogenase maturation nickel metallochaperone HypA/HybF n=1 Tax=Thiomicrorhabdus sp. TaxID=2039724 RepID=UPI0029C87EF6|nr:hydrogenase maturation nickel metallochaperone HypA [Thiomicrorhabdus sp.]